MVHKNKPRALSGKLHTACCIAELCVAQVAGGRGTDYASEKEPGPFWQLVRWLFNFHYFVIRELFCFNFHMYFRLCKKCLLFLHYTINFAVGQQKQSGICLRLN